MKYIAFDLGNVLINLDWEPFNKTVELFPGIKNIQDDICNLDFCGLITYSNYLKTNKRLEKEILNIVINSWNQMLKPNEQMIEFIKELKSKYYKVAYLSNMGYDHYNFLNKEYKDFMDLADVQHISCKVGACKPSLLYFQSFLNKNPEFTDCLFIDDIKENLETAKELCFNTYQLNISKLSDIELSKEIQTIKDWELSDSFW
jgi:putative hydrolase of the HAD superfamily